MHKSYLFPLLFTSLMLASGMTDYQIWHAEKVSKALSDGNTISLDVDSRFRNNGSEQYYFHGDLKYYFTILNGVKIGVSFREIFSLKSQGWVREHRPNVEFSLKRKAGNTTASLRNRFEYRIFSDKTAYRNRTLITQTIPLFAPYSLYVADELFYDITNDEFNTNRIYLGLNLGRWQGAKIGLYSMWQSNLNGDTWTTFQVSGLKIGF